MGKFTSFLLFAIVALKHEINCDNIILGTVASSGHSAFGGGSAQQQYSNNNGVVASCEEYTTYEQKPDGKCVRKVVTVKNGISDAEEFPIDCEEAKKEIDSIAEKTRQEIYQKHETMMKQHYQALENINKQIQEMQASFPKFV